LNSSVFSWRQNAKYVDDVLTDEGNAFQAHAAASEKARSPRVARRVDGTIALFTRLARVNGVHHMPVWRSGNALDSINVVTLLVPGQVSVFGRENHPGTESGTLVDSA